MRTLWTDLNPANCVETVPVTVVCAWSGTVDCVGHCVEYCGLCGTLWDTVDCARHCGLCRTLCRILPGIVPDTMDYTGNSVVRLCGTLWTVPDTVDYAGQNGLCRTLWTVSDTGLCGTLLDCAGHCRLCETLWMWTLWTVHG
jgi:hypothetical protein